MPDIPVAISQVSRRLVAISTRQVKIIAISQIVRQIVAVALIQGPAGRNGINGSPGVLPMIDAPDDLTMAVKTAYRPTDNVDLCLLSLPLDADSAIGDPVNVYGYGLGGWKIIQRAGEQILISGSQNNTTAGVTGYLEFQYVNDGVELIKIASNTWLAKCFGCSFG